MVKRESEFRPAIVGYIVWLVLIVGSFWIVLATVSGLRAPSQSQDYIIRVNIDLPDTLVSTIDDIEEVKGKAFVLFYSLPTSECAKCLNDVAMISRYLSSGIQLNNNHTQLVIADRKSYNTSNIRIETGMLSIYYPEVNIDALWNQAEKVCELLVVTPDPRRVVLRIRLLQNRGSDTTRMSEIGDSVLEAINQPLLLLSDVR